MNFSGIWLVAAGAALLLILIRIFFSPARFAVKAMLNTAAGFVWLWIIDALGAGYGITLGFNLINAVIIGIFGLPGTALLLIGKWAVA